MQAVTEMSNGMVPPSCCGMDTVTAFPPNRGPASNSLKSNSSWL